MINGISIFIFYNVSNGPQSFLSLSKKFKHCNVINFDGKNCILIEYDLAGFRIEVLKFRDLTKIIEGLKRIKKVEAILSASISERKKVPWWPLWGRTCNEMCRYGTGIDIGKTFNPIHLYKKLLKYDKVKNYTILSQWMRDDHGRR